MKNARKTTGFQYLYMNKLPKEDITTTRRLIDEYFTSLQYYSEIEEVGLELIKARGHVDPIQQKRIFTLFKSFVRQGRTFFEAAEKLEYRASPLLYYYSFLNLTKACLCINNPDDVDKQIHHGLRYCRQTSEDFQSQSVQVKEGVFPLFYRTLMGTSEKIPSLNISNLLSYIVDISYEYKMVNYGPSKFTVGFSKVFANKNTKKAWPFLAISKLKETENYDDFFKSFYEYFEEVNLDNTLSERIFNINAEQHELYSFFQSKKEYEFTPEGFIPRLQIRDDCLLFMKNYCKPVSTNSFGEYHIFLPLEEKYPIPFNDILAIYVTMFYLGSLVRYYPSYLEDLLNSKHAWIIEAFTKQVGIAFLRNISNLIIQKNQVFSTL